MSTEREELMERAKAGDPAAFEELVRRHHGRLTIWIRLRMGRLLRARISEDDVLQETLLHIFRNLDDFRDRGPESFRRWIFALAEHRLKDLHRYHAAQRRDPAREVAPATEHERDLIARVTAGLTSPSSRARRKENTERLVQGIDGLPEPERDVMLMRSFEELSYREIGERIGKREAAVAALYARALLLLKRQLRP